VKRWNAMTGAGTPADNPATYLYYEGWDLIAEGSDSIVISRIYAHGNRIDEIVADSSDAGTTWAYHHFDARTHCIMLTDASGNLLEQYDYDAFGRAYYYDASGNSLTTSAWGNRFLFTGREWLSDLGVYDFRARLYLPELGRFVQPDPKEFSAGDYNIYRYCHNDPVNKSDPTGLWVLQTPPDTESRIPRRTTFGDRKGPTLLLDPGTLARVIGLARSIAHDMVSRSQNDSEFHGLEYSAEAERKKANRNEIRLTEIVRGGPVEEDGTIRNGSHIAPPTNDQWEIIAHIFTQPRYRKEIASWDKPKFDYKIKPQIAAVIVTPPESGKGGPEWVVAYNPPKQ
jgi:RHS repeat-associated protein